VLGLVGLAATAIVPAYAADTTDVQTAAQITGSDAAPNIECSWILPDMQTGVGGTTSVNISWPPNATVVATDVGTVQYIPSTLEDIHDDDPNLTPSPAPCFVPLDGSGHATAKPSFDGNTDPLVTINANLENQPEERAIELWAAVDHLNGISNISDVYWKIYHPDGSFKLQVHGTKVGIEDCANWGSGHGPVSAGQDGMFEAAVHSGQVQAEAVDDTNYGMIALCQQELKAFYHISFPLSKDQQCGVYRAEVTAVSTGGTTTKQSIYFDDPCTFALVVDFDTVDWGTITPGNTKVLGGNLIWDPQVGTTPTVKNIGNDGMGLTIEFTRLVGANEAKVIDKFDAKFGRSPSTLYAVDMDANVVTDLSPTPDQILCANELGKLDLSVHPPLGLPQDNYVGEVYLTGYHVADECKGNQHIVAPTS
jgi:hypothetical protein